MAVKSRYMGYMKGLQKISQKTEMAATQIYAMTSKRASAKASIKESVLDRLKSLKGKEFHMTIPVKENADA